MLNRIMGFFRSKMGGGSGEADSASRQQADSARQELMANAHKALQMKQEAANGANIPPHQTAHEGMQVNETQEDHTPAREGYFQPELKRTKVARSGDAS
jgi:hypothetical protein